jgi:hypothetical protein
MRDDLRFKRGLRYCIHRNGLRPGQYGEFVLIQLLPDNAGKQRLENGGEVAENGGRLTWCDGCMRRGSVLVVGSRGGRRRRRRKRRGRSIAIISFVQTMRQKNTALDNEAA